MEVGGRELIQDISLLPLSAAILSGALIVTAGLAPRRKTLAGLFFLGLNLSTLLWSLAYFLQLNWGSYADPALAPYGTVDYVLIWLTSLGVAGAPTYWFLFGAADAHNRFWTSRNGILVAHLPLAYTILVSVTNPSHHLFLSEGAGGMQQYGPLAVPHFLATFVLVIAGIRFLTAQPVLGHTAAGRRKAIMLGVASAVPLAGGLLFAMRLLAGNPLPINPTPVLFPALNVVLAYQVMRGELGDIVPLSTLSAIMENTETHLAFLDPQYVIVSANSAFVRRSGHSEQELLGHDYFDLFPESGRRELFEAARESGRPVERHSEKSLFREDSPMSVSYWDWTLREVRDATGELQGFVLSLQDVTESVQAGQLSETLNELAARVHADFASDDVIRTVVAEAASAIGAESSSITINRDGRWSIMQRCEAEDSSWEDFSPDDFPHIGLALRSGQTIGIQDARNDERLNPSMMKALNVRAALVVPMMGAGRHDGAISFVTRSSTTRFSRSQVDFTERLAASMTLAWENLRLYESERRIAETLQESMLSVPRKIPGIEFEHIYRSAAESARVGGDFYDLFEIDGDHVGILIGDVSGKGIEAAVTTSLVKNAIRANAYEDLSPRIVLRKTNEIVRKQTEPELFATAFLGVLDTRTGILMYSSAGHPPPMLLHPSGQVSPLSEHSALLGVFEEADYIETEATVERGDVLVLYTDGVTEARSEGRMFGEEGIVGLLTDWPDGQPAAVVNAVFDEVMKFTDNNLGDDLALVAVRRAAS